MRSRRTNKAADIIDPGNGWQWFLEGPVTGYMLHGAKFL